MAGTVSPNCASVLSFDAKASPTKGSFQQPWGIHSLGHFLTLKHQEECAANDRFQGTTDAVHRLHKVSKSPKRSLGICDASRHQVPTEYRWSKARIGSTDPKRTDIARKSGRSAA
jgi:hypothetical protein